MLGLYRQMLGPKDLHDYAYDLHDYFGFAAIIAGDCDWFLALPPRASALLRFLPGTVLGSSS